VKLNAESGASNLRALDEPLVTPLMAKAWPNPSSGYFNLQVNGNSKEKVVVNVFTITGALIYKTEGTANRTYRLGDGWVNGAYLVEVRQGAE